jgi:hypothetical protein
MPILRVPIILLVLALAAFASPPGCAPARSWTSLMPSASLDGWVVRGGAATYALETIDGLPTIVGTTAPDSPNTFLCTSRAYADFELTLEFRTHPELNSGVQFRSLSLSDYKDGRVHGYQCEIDPTPRAWTGGIYDEGRRGWLADLSNNPEARAAFRQGAWNTMRIRAAGDELTTWINGVPCVQDFRDAMTREGFIALQVHGVGPRKDPLTSMWRRIEIVEILSSPEPRGEPD